MAVSMSWQEAKFGIKDVIQFIVIAVSVAIAYGKLVNNQQKSEENFASVKSDIQELKVQSKEGNSKNDVLYQNFANQVNLNTQQIELLKQQVEFIKQQIASAKR